MTLGQVPASGDVDVQLAQLAAEINAEHRLFQTALRSSLDRARSAGELLIQAKGLCSHGTWLAWLADHFEGSERTAQAYMRVAHLWPTIEAAKSATVADLSYSEALRALAAPHIDDALDPAELEALANSSQAETCFVQGARQILAGGQPAAAPGPEGQHPVAPMSRAEAEAAVAEIRRYLAHIAPVVGADAMHAWHRRVVEADDRDAIAAAFDALKAQTTPERVQSYLETCFALLEIRDRRGYHQAGYRTFETYCADRWGFTRDQVAEAMAFAERIVAGRAGGNIAPA